MKCVHSLSGVAIVSFLSLHSGVAMSKVIEQVPNPTSSAQTKPVVMANFFRDMQKVIQTVDQVNQIRLREQRKQELEAARREATEQQRLEAEQRRQYFESLSPEEQQAYLAEQRVKKAQRDQAASLFLLMMGAMMFGGSSSGGGAEGSSNDLCIVYNSDGTPAYTTTRDQAPSGGGVECRSR